jgi:dihydrofolate reductase
MINLIVATNTQNIIGQNNDLIWKIPEDLKHFKETTLNSNIIMGRKTYESIGRPLPKRKNIIITRNLDYKCDERCVIVNDVKSAIKECDKTMNIFVIGGSQIYKTFLDENLINRVYLTVIKDEVDDEEGMTYFNFEEYKDRNNFKLQSSRTSHNENYSYDFLVFDKNE